MTSSNPTIQPQSMFFKYEFIPCRLSLETLNVVVTIPKNFGVATGDVELCDGLHSLLFGVGYI